MKFKIVFVADSEVAAHATCRRCGLPTENSPMGFGQFPTSKDAESVVLCLYCLELMYTREHAFWSTGWDNGNRR